MQLTKNINMSHYKNDPQHGRFALGSFTISSFKAAGFGIYMYVHREGWDAEGERLLPIFSATLADPPVTSFPALIRIQSCKILR